MKDMSLKELQREIHQNAVVKGWYAEDVPVRSDLENHMLAVSEIAEATEAVRKGEPDVWITDKGKPEGQSVELADAIIRILDFAEFKGWDMGEIVALKHEYNKHRPYRHGGKLK